MTMTMKNVTKMVLLLSIAVACGGKSNKSQPTTPTAGMGGPGGVAATETPSMCVAVVPGVEAQIRTTSGGAIVAFTAPSDQVDALRERVQDMAQQHEKQPVAGTEPGATSTSDMTLPPAEVRVEEIPGGAEVTFNARDPNDVQMLQQAAQIQVDRMRAGACVMATQAAPSETTSGASGGY